MKKILSIAIIIMLAVTAGVATAGTYEGKAIKAKLASEEQAISLTARMGIYLKFFPTDPPNRNTVAVAGLDDNLDVEIEVIAAAD